VAVAACVALLAACSREHASGARAKIRKEHAPYVAKLVVEDLQRHTVGLRKAAERIGAGFVKVTGEQQATEMRQVFTLLRSPKKGVPELIISPMSFIAAVDMNGVVIARNGDDDRMKGMDLGADFPVVKAALQGHEGYQIGEFQSLEKGGEPSASIVMAAPAHYGGQVVGALVLGIPLWRLQQRLSKQLQMEEAGKPSGDEGGGAGEGAQAAKDKGAPSVVIWVYLYRGDKLHHHGTPRDLDKLVPDAKARAAGYATSPGGFTGEAVQFGYWYGYGVRPLRVLGDDVGMVVFRMDPQ
jgi:hypothetical protein